MYRKIADKFKFGTNDVSPRRKVAFKIFNRAMTKQCWQQTAVYKSRHEY